MLGWIFLTLSILVTGMSWCGVHNVRGLSRTREMLAELAIIEWISMCPQGSESVKYADV